jgi:hypothetical protein
VDGGRGEKALSVPAGIQRRVLLQCVRDRFTSISV